MSFAVMSQIPFVSLPWTSPRRGGRTLASPLRALWQRLLGRPASESGTLRHGDGTHGRGDRCRRSFVLPILSRYRQAGVSRPAPSRHAGAHARVTSVTETFCLVGRTLTVSRGSARASPAPPSVSVSARKAASLSARVLR